MATDSNGKPVSIGDSMIAAEDGGTRTLVRVVGLNQTAKGVTAIGAYVAMEGQGRVKKFSFDPASATMVLKANGELP